MSVTKNAARKRIGTVFAVAGALSIALTACSGGNSGSGDSNTLTLGFPGSIGTTDVPAVLALEALKEDGWDASYIEFDSPDVQTQALLRGDVNVASMGPATVMSADLAGSDIKMVANNNNNDLQVIASPDITECADLDGKPVAYQSDGATSTAHLKRWLQDNCPDAQPEFMVISGSANRATALLEGQISGTIVRLEDWIPAIEGHEGEAEILASLSADQSDLLTQTIAVTNESLESNPDLTQAFLEALQAEFDELNADPTAYADKAAEILDVDPAEAAAVYEQLVEEGVIPETVGIDMSHVDATLTFYQENGTIPEGDLTSSDVADDRFNS